MDKITENGICIYCCGSGGKVGWVSGWELRHEVGTPIVKLNLSLYHNDAQKFNDDYTINKVLEFIDRNSGVYGDYHVFEW